MTPHIRIQNDFTVQWGIFLKTEEGREEYNLEGKELILRLQNPYRTENLTNFTVRGNVIEWTFLGKDQKALGPYTLILVENQGKQGMVSIDKVNAFTLVAHTEEETGNDEGAVKIRTINLESESVIIGGGVGSVDTELNRDSENAIANKTVTLAFEGVTESLGGIYENLAGLTKTAEDLAKDLKDKQDTIADLEDIRNGAQKGATAIQKVKTINGQSIEGEGNIEIKVDLSEIEATIESNEKVTAAALTDLDTRMKQAVATFKHEDTAIKASLAEAQTAITDIETSGATKAELAQIEETLRTEIISNEKVTAAALNDLNGKIADLAESVIGALNTEV